MYSLKYSYKSLSQPRYIVSLGDSNKRLWKNWYKKCLPKARKMGSLHSVKLEMTWCKSSQNCSKGKEERHDKLIFHKS